MNRDYKRFPNDENGDVLWRMFQNSDKLDKPRTINFSVIFPTREAALGFGAFLLEQQQRVQFLEYEENQDMPWEITVSPIMAATYEKITAYEAQLENDAAKWGGRNDGWGCFEQE